MRRAAHGAFGLAACSAALDKHWKVPGNKRAALPEERRHCTSDPGYQAHIKCAGRPAAASAVVGAKRRGRLPWLASRGWSRVGARLPCPDPKVRDTFLRRIGRAA